ncbi:MAG: type II toxin-antitoxin system HipA family toxin [Petrimonas sp.]|uniref:type II toxin-antitoxin system HipA family toxin n=1 Tax=Petrimonas sp. TaxID=2023866 RepID=UPI002B396116|nr:type II toxin-antitoxin system HipA family toxin [Petrimonas sp.]
MNIILKIRLWNNDVGAAYWDDERNCAVLEFYESFALKGWDIAPLIMPLDDLKRGERLYYFPENRGKTLKGLPGFMADSLPDDYGTKIMDEWFAAKGRSAVEFTPLDRLSYIGKRGMSALEYEPANHDPILTSSSQLDIGQLTELAKEVLNKREQFKANIRSKNNILYDIIKIGTSAGGAKPKALIALNKQTGDVRSGQVLAPEGYTYWLLKFDGVEDKKVTDNPLGIGRIEYSYYRMATDCGIEMTECRLLEDKSYAHFITKRFDRTDTGTKLYTQSLCALAHFDRDKPYSYEQTFGVMRRLHLPYPDMEQMYRRMVFNVIARNHDDHTKNHSFIMTEAGEWRLAPAYDLCFSYSAAGKWTNRHQMSVNNKRDNFTKEDLLTVGRNIGIRNYLYIVDEIIDVVSKWSSYAKENEVNPQYAEHISKVLRITI